VIILANLFPGAQGHKIRVVVGTRFMIMDWFEEPNHRHMNVYPGDPFSLGTKWSKIWDTADVNACPGKRGKSYSAGGTVKAEGRSVLVMISSKS
jgi:hypothetical protein